MNIHSGIAGFHLELSHAVFKNNPDSHFDICTGLGITGSCRYNSSATAG